MEFLSVGDNQGAVGVMSGGRAKNPTQNRDMRSLAAHEIVTETRLRGIWAPTSAQPADTGTRPDSMGRLEVGPVWWKPRKTVALVGGRARSLWHEALAGVNVDILCFPSCDFGGGPSVSNVAKPLLRLAESGTLLAALIAPRSGWGSFTDPAACDYETDSWFPILLKVIMIATRGFAAIVIEQHHGSNIWNSILLRSLLGSIQADSVTVQLPRLGIHRCHRRFVVGTLAGLDSVASARHGHRRPRGGGTAHGVVHGTDVDVVEGISHALMVSIGSPIGLLVARGVGAGHALAEPAWHYCRGSLPLDEERGEDLPPSLTRL